jgi:hypothetical protein
MPITIGASNDCQFTYIGPSVAKLRGVSVAEVMRQSWAEIFPPESLALVQERFQDFIDRLRRGEPLHRFHLELAQTCRVSPGSSWRGASGMSRPKARSFSSMGLRPGWLHLPSPAGGSERRRGNWLGVSAKMAVADSSDEEDGMAGVYITRISR